MKYYIDLTQVEEKLIFFEKELQIINDEINYLQSLPNNLFWKSDSSNVFLNKYNCYISHLEDLKMGLLHYIKIFAQFSGKYNDFYEQMKNKYNYSLVELESGVYDGNSV